MFFWTLSAVRPTCVRPESSGLQYTSKFVVKSSACLHKSTPTKKKITLMKYIPWLSWIATAAPSSAFYCKAGCPLVGLAGGSSASASRNPLGLRNSPTKWVNQFDFLSMRPEEKVCMSQSNLGKYSGNNSASASLVACFENKSGERMRNSVIGHRKLDKL